MIEGIFDRVVERLEDHPEIHIPVLEWDDHTLALMNRFREAGYWLIDIFAPTPVDGISESEIVVFRDREAFMKAWSKVEYVRHE